MSRRRWHGLKPARDGAVIVGVALVAAIVGPCADAVRSGGAGTAAAARRPDAARIRSASTSSGATSSRACSPARASRFRRPGRRARVGGGRHGARRHRRLLRRRRRRCDQPGHRHAARVSRGCCWRLRWSPCSGRAWRNVLFALTIIGWVGYARLVRGQVLRAREFEYVQAARALGARHRAHSAGSTSSRPRFRRSSCRRRSAWPARSSAKRR